MCAGKYRTRCAHILWLTVTTSVALSGCGAPNAIKRVKARGSDPQVRVGLLVRQPDASISVHGPYWVRSHAGSAEIPAASFVIRIWQADGTVFASRNDGVEYRDPSRIVLEPAAAESRARVGDDIFAGQIVIYRAEDRITVVNELPLEEYLRGVVPWEIGRVTRSERAAVEAQAIAARTYACKRFEQYEGEPFDVLPGVADQVYRGVTRTDSVADQAIAATRGMTLLDGKRLIEAYYCSTCGGHTSRIDAVWDKPFESYLQGVRDADASGRSYCTDSPHFRWTEVWSGTEMESLLAVTLPPEIGLTNAAIGGLLDLRTVGRGESGRVERLEVETEQGVYTVHGDRIRWVLRPKGRPILRSTLINLEVQRDGDQIVRVIVQGGGNGHGVGMCQMGALEMSRRGAGPLAILTHYYPGTRLELLYR